MTEERSRINQRTTDAAIQVHFDPELREMVRRRSEDLQVDEPTFVQWCITTGLFLGDLNAFVGGKFKRP